MIIFLLLFNLYNFSSSQILKYSFFTNKNNIDLNPILNLINNELQINLEIGEPIQTIPCILKTRKFFFLITGSLNSDNIKKFNEKESTTFIPEGDEFIMENQDFITAIKGSDNFKLPNNKKIRLNFLLSNKLNYIESGKIGLKLIDINPLTKEKHFIYQLKSNKLLNYYSFFLEFNDEEKGNFVLGDYPHEYNSKKYNKNQFIYIRSGKMNNLVDWIIDFDEIKFGDFHFSIKKASIEYEKGLIIAPSESKNHILKTYFNDSINKNICFEEIKNNLTFYYCNKDNFSIKNFPNLFFVLKDSNFSFEFKKDDLFLIENNKIYFKIAFQTFQNPKLESHWILGQYFFKKYMLVFDLDKKIIGFYNDKIQVEGTKKGKKLKTFFVICLLLFIIGEAIFIYFYYNKKNRRVRAYELNEGIDYENVNNKSLNKNSLIN
jgi:hypothetical protein